MKYSMGRNTENECELDIGCKELKSYFFVVAIGKSFNVIKCERGD